MPLSEYEQHVLDELEQELADESRGNDPFRRWTGRARRGSRPRTVLRCLTGAVGLMLIVVGLRIADGVGVFVAVIGYGLTVVAAASAVTAARQRWRRGRPGSAPTDIPDGTSAA